MELSKELFIDSKGQIDLVNKKTKMGKWLDQNGFIFDFKKRYNGK